MKNSSAKPRRSPKRAPAAAPIYCLRIMLAEVAPPVWRRVRVSG